MRITPAISRGYLHYSCKRSNWHNKQKQRVVEFSCPCRKYSSTMNKLFITLFLFLFIGQVRGQQEKLGDIFLEVQYNHTSYDVTKGNNKAFLGLGAQAFLNITNTKLNVTLEVTGDINIMDDKVGRYRWDGTFDSGMPLIDNVGSMVTLLAGLSHQPVKRFYYGIAAGPGFINGNIHLALKPAIGYMTGNHRWTGKLSFINIYNRELPAVVIQNKDYKMKDFGVVSFTIGLRLNKS